MSELLWAWLGEAERQRDEAQAALQQGDDRPMKLWALLYGYPLIAKVEELTGALELLVSAARGIPHNGDNLVMNTLEAAIEEAESTLHVPGG